MSVITILDHGHAHCLMCGHRNPRSLRLRFQSDSDGRVSASFQAFSELQGYEGILHGGIVVGLLDAAMTHCLFNQGIRAVTGDLRARFLQPIGCQCLLHLQAWPLTLEGPVYRVRAELRHRNRVMAWAKASFMRGSVNELGAAQVRGEGNHEKGGDHHL